MINTRSVKNKVAEIRHYIVDNDADMLIITETWLSSQDNVVVNRLVPDGYEIKHQARENRRGGGVAIVYKSSISVDIKSKGITQSMEYIDACVSFENTSCELIVIYRPGTNPNDGQFVPISVFFDDFTSILDRHYVSTYEVVIAGDFDFNLNGCNDAEVSQFMDILLTYDLNQHVRESTHENGHILDLIIIRSSSNFVRNVKVDYKISDHFSIKCHLSLGKPAKEVKKVTFRKLTQIDFEKLNSDLCDEFMPLQQLTDIDTLVTAYDSTLRKILDKHAPEQDKIITIRNKHRGFTDDLREEKKKRRRLERRWRRTKSAVDRDKFVKQKLKLRKLLEDSDTAFYSNLVMENSHSTKGLFKVVNNMLNKKTESPLPKHDSTLQLANEFVDFFDEKIEKIQNHLDLAMNLDENNIVVPEEPKYKTQMTTFCHLSEDNVEKLIKKSPITTCDLDPLQTWILRRCGEPFVKIATLIINTSLQTSAMPDRFKLAILNPHLKKAGLEIINANFRPVSNLAYASKLIERAVANQLVQHMVENDLFEPLQSAYREGHSTETALLRVQTDLLMAMDKQKVSILVLLDLSAAFDTVNHSVLLFFFYIPIKFYSKQTKVTRRCHEEHGNT